jgi:nanoRNase/pAp phosphatase (c-di-AMP/oligoRNAs hydrolase)
MKKPLCIYHGACDDGFGAAYSIWLRYRDDFEYYPGVYQMPPPDVRERDVYLVDFSYKHPVMEQLCQQAQSVVILDHHKSAMEDLAGLEQWAKAQGLDVTAKFDMTQSGAMITWKHFHFDEPPPKLIEYIQERDLGRSTGDVPIVSMALRSYPYDFNVWSKLSVTQLREEGEHIFRYYKNIISQLKGNVITRTIGGYEVPTVNANYTFASDLAGELANGQPFAAVWFQNRDGLLFSLRSETNAVDVSEIAKLYGGGGHRQAAGFRVSSLQDLFEYSK